MDLACATMDFLIDNPSTNQHCNRQDLSLSGLESPSRLASVTAVRPSVRPDPYCALPYQLHFGRDISCPPQPPLTLTCTCTSGGPEDKRFFPPLPVQRDQMS
jgi:hypothetical protein